MTWMWRFAVGVAILVILEFALSSPSQLGDWKKSESVKLSDQNVVRAHHREKRFAMLAVFGALFNVAKFTYGRLSDANGQVQQKLIGIEQRLDSLVAQLGDTLQGLRNDHQWLEGAIMYSNDIGRLQYILNTLNQFTVDAAGKLQPETEVREWADGILSISGRSIGQVLYSMHNMVTGGSHLFGNAPIVTLVKNTLNPRASDYSVKLRVFANATYNLQMSGYFAWATAMNVMNRSSGISHIKELVQERFQEEQQSLIMSLMTAWPSGQYGLPRRKQLDDICPSPPTAWRYGNMTWFNGYNQDYLRFCMRADTEQLSEKYRGEGEWPAGTYCIYQQGPSCPAGFDSSAISYTAYPGRLIKSGALPHFSYTDRTNTISYCCRSDGSPQIGIRLPPIVRFSLPRSGERCQEVLNMRIHPNTERYMYNYRYRPVYVGNASLSRPSIVTTRLWESVILCYYEPIFWI